MTSSAAGYYVNKVLKFYTEKKYVLSSRKKKLSITVNPVTLNDGLRIVSIWQL